MNMVAVAQALTRELSNCPRLNKNNLHSFRLKMKELRSILQLPARNNTKLIVALSEAKDAIGAWHDWNVLAAISQKIVRRNPACRLQKQVELISREKLKRAMAVANELQKKCRRSLTSPNQQV